MDLVSYYFMEDELRFLEDALRCLLISTRADVCVLSDEGGRKVAGLSFFESLEPLISRVAVISAGLVGGLELLDQLIGSRNFFVVSVPHAGRWSQGRTRYVPTAVLTL